MVRLLILLVLGALSACAAEPISPLRLAEARAAIVKDPDVLRDLRVSPRACTGQPSCPDGSRCAAGYCTYDCIEDADCGPSDRCSDLGVCVIASVTQVCLADTAYDPIGDPQSCAAGESCPMGFHCAAGVTCDAECSVGDDEACESGEVCSCRGECVKRGVLDTVAPADGKPRLELGLTSIRIDDPSAPHAFFDVTLTSSVAVNRATTVMLAGIARPAPIPAGESTAPPPSLGVRVSCDSSATAPQGNYAEACELAFPPLTRQGDVFRASKRVWVTLGPAHAAELARTHRLPVQGERWLLELASNDVLGGPRHVEVQIGVPATGPLAEQREGLYQGSALLHAPALTASDRPLALPVEVWVTPGQLLLLEPTGSLAEAGVIVTTPGGASEARFTTANAADTSAVMARYAWSQLQIAGGRLAGELGIELVAGSAWGSLPRQLKVSFDLARVNDVTARACGAGCEAGSACEPQSQLCVPAPLPAAAPRCTVLSPFGVRSCTADEVADRTWPWAGLPYELLRWHRAAEEAFAEAYVHNDLDMQTQRLEVHSQEERATRTHSAPMIMKAAPRAAVMHAGFDLALTDSAMFAPIDDGMTFVPIDDGMTFAPIDDGMMFAPIDDALAIAPAAPVLEDDSMIFAPAEPVLEEPLADTRTLPFASSYAFSRTVDGGLDRMYGGAGLDLFELDAPDLLPEDFGYDLCLRDFAPATEWPFAAYRYREIPDVRGCALFFEGAHEQRLYSLDLIHGAESTRLCDAMYRETLQGVCPQIAEPGASQERERRRRFIPCVVGANLAPGEGRFIPRNEYEQYQRGKNDLSCESLVKRSVGLSGTSTGVADWEHGPLVVDYLRQHCVSTDYEYTAREMPGAPVGPHGLTSFHVYLCPAVPALIGPTEGDSLAERLACYPAPSSSQDYPIVTSRLDASQRLPISGELRCADNERGRGPLPQAMPLFTRKDDPAITSGNALVSLLFACLDDLAEPRDGQNLHGLLARRECVSLARTLPAIFDSPAFRTNVPASDGYAARLLSRWAQLHTFVATQGLEEVRLQRAVGPTPEYGALGYEDLVAQLRAGAALFLALPGRLALLGAGLRDDAAGATYEQAAGLPIAIVDLAAALQRVARDWVEDVARSTYLDCQTSTLRRTVLAEASAISRESLLLVTVGAHLREVGGDSLEATRWQSVRSAEHAARRNLEEALRTAVTCAHPYGMVDGFTPLYFDNPVGDKPEFFAASDYLLDHARRAIDEAGKQLERTRSAWMSERAEILQVERNGQARRERIAAIESSFGATLSEACGLGSLPNAEVLSRFTSGQLQVETCHLASTQPGCDLDPSRDGCLVSGSLADAAYGIVAAKQEIEIAQASYAAGQGRYLKQINYCTGLEKRVVQRTEAIRHYLETVEDIEATMTTIKRVVAIAGATAAVVATGGGAAAIGGAAVAAGGSKTLEYLLDDMGHSVASAQRSHQAMGEVFGLEENVRSCFHQADMMVGELATAVQVIAKRGIELKAAALRHDNLLDRARSAVSEGRAALEREQDGRISMVAHHYWKAEASEQYQRAFETARRLSLVALAAVDYDNQLPAGAAVRVRRAIFEAQSPADLAAQLGVPDRFAGAPIGNFTRSINQGQPPNATSVVISLSRLLGLPATQGEEVSRLHELIMHPSAAIYDANGRYQGQEISFAIAPGQLGEFGALCAERIKKISINVSASPNAVRALPLRLLKDVRFESHWCEPEDHDATLQSGRIGTPREVLGSTVGGPARPRKALEANVMAAMGLSLDEFQTGSGPTTGSVFAGTGLYGAYHVIIPREVLFPQPGSLYGLPDTRRGIADIQLRFDLLAIPDSDRASSP